MLVLKTHKPYSMKNALCCFILSMLFHQSFTQNATDSIYVKGKIDASNYYEAKHCGANGTIWTTVLLSPIIGLIPAIVCSVSEPEISNLNAPDNKLLENPTYLAGYMKEAHKIKRRKLWVSYGVTSGISIATLAILNEVR